MSRRDNAPYRCVTCLMHQSLCICSEIETLPSRVRLTLVMHRDEVRKTTNTGRLAARCLSQSQILVHGEPQKPLQAPPNASAKALLLFPSDDAVELGSFALDDDVIELFVPDGTWRQAAKMSRRLPWLAQMRRVTLPKGPHTRYHLRAEHVENGLATAEAIARAVGILDGAQAQRSIERALRIMIDRTLFSRGTLDRQAVLGGISPHIMRHEPRGPQQTHLKPL